MLATLAVTLLGDGLADTPKQGHLIVNAAFAWIVAGLMMGVRTRNAARVVGASRPPPPPS